MESVAQDQDTEFFVIPAPPLIAKRLYSVAHTDRGLATYSKLYVRKKNERTYLISTDYRVAFLTSTTEPMHIKPGDYRFYAKNVKHLPEETHMLVMKEDPPAANIFSLFLDDAEKEKIGTVVLKSYLRLNTFASFRINVKYFKLLTPAKFNIYTDRRPTQPPRYQFEASGHWPLILMIMPIEAEAENS